MKDGRSFDSLIKEEYSEAGKIASFYGFHPIKSPSVEKVDSEVGKGMIADYFPLEKSAMMRFYMSGPQGMPQPGMFWVERPFHGEGLRKSSKLDCGLYIINSAKSVSEVLGIQAGVAILNHIGYKNLELRINSVGDKDSASDFERKLNNYIRKNIDSLPPDLRLLIKKDLFSIIKEKSEKWQEFQKACPQSIEFLSEPSREHFKEVLELLEVIGLPYSIDPSLIGDRSYSAEIIFDIVDSTNGAILASGGSWNKIAKQLGAKKDIPGFTLNISAKPSKALKNIKHRKPMHKFYLVQFGPEAKMKSFLVLEALRKIGASVLHSLAKDKLGSQIGMAENSNIPYILLLGQKEAIDNAVVIRTNVTRSQISVPIAELAEYVKKLDLKE